MEGRGAPSGSGGDGDGGGAAYIAVDVDGEAPPEGAGAGAGAAGTPELAPGAVPWRKGNRALESQLLRLHQEIVEFCRFVQPTAEEQAAREAALERVRAVVRELHPSSSVQVFGSFASGLYLPTSDMDLVVMESGAEDVRSALRKLADTLSRRGVARDLEVRANARVPIVKFTDTRTGLDFDISFDVGNGPGAAALIRAAIRKLPPLLPLTLVLKLFLQQREMNEVYSGGIGSYALITMVLSFLLLHPSRRAHLGRRGGGGRGGAGVGEAAVLEGNLGVLLVDFLKLYGRELNMQEVGVSCAGGGQFYSKRRMGFFQPERPFLLSVQDPRDPDNDVARNSYNIGKVRDAFDWAYQVLCASHHPRESILSKVIRLDPVLLDRPRMVGPAGPLKFDLGLGNLRRRGPEGRPGESGSESGSGSGSGCQSESGSGTTGGSESGTSSDSQSDSEGDAAFEAIFGAGEVALEDSDSEEGQLSDWDSPRPRKRRGSRHVKLPKGKKGRKRHRADDDGDWHRGGGRGGGGRGKRKRGGGGGRWTEKHFNNKHTRF